MKRLKQIIETEWFLIKTLFTTDVIRGVLYWFVVGILYAIPLITVWLWKLILDELTTIYLTSLSTSFFWLLLGIYLSLRIMVSILEQIKLIIYDRLFRKTTFQMDMRIMRKMADIDISFFDDPKKSDIKEAALTSEDYIASNISWAIDITTRIVAFVSGLVVFLSYNWLIGIIYMATYIPGAIVSYKYKIKVDQWSIESIPENRKKNYYKSLLTGRFAAKDLRIYNLAGFFKEKYNTLWNKLRNMRAKMFVRGSLASFLASILTYSGIVAIILLSVRSVLLGSMAIGTLALYIGLAKNSGENFSTIIDALACQVEIDVPHVLQYKQFLNYTNAIKDDGKETVPSSFDVEFRDVCFKYPGNNDYTLKNLSFKIENGKKIALVGVNGAGKTTIIKLLLRFYNPESGEILLGGKRISNYSRFDLHKVFGVCFQDIIQYSLPFRDNIAISDISRKKDNASLMEAIEASDLKGVLNSLPKGLETEMTRQFDNKGVELSGGQWQRIALARAFFRDSQFIILDEPSSSLDPEAEAHIFSSFKQLCESKSGILISHRLSNIMLVDEIVLIDKGSVIECGTHIELMKKRGKYAEMYHLQAKKYSGRSANE